jgi:UDP-glucuronate 4-epimerase
MKILITGTAGFIGFWTAQSLSAQGHEVIGADRYSNFYSTKLKEMRSGILKKDFNIKTINLDLSEDLSVKELFNQNPVECVIHLAAQPGVRLPASQRDVYVKDNMLAHFNVLNQVLLREVPYFLYASSSSVYGDLNVEKLREGIANLRPNSFYGTTKLINEQISENLTNDSSTRSRGLRFFSVYGPWGRPDMAYSKIIAALETGEIFNVFGDTSVLRDFTYISDVVESISLLLTNLSNQPEGYSDVVNVGGGRPVSLAEVIATLEELSEKKLNLAFLNRDNRDVISTDADTTRLFSLTSNLPQIDINEGLARTYNWATSNGINSGWMN